MLSYKQTLEGEGANENQSKKRDGSSEGVAENIGGATQQTAIYDRKSGAKNSNKENVRVSVS